MNFNSNLFVNIDDFEFVNKLGSGTYGNLGIVKEKKTQKLYAARFTIASLEEGYEQEKMMREVVILKMVHHPSILEYVGFSLYDFESNGQPVIITEYMKNGSLEKILALERSGKAPKDWNSTKKQIVLIGISAAMSHLHHRQIVHRNLKPSNILLDENLYPKVSDFGLAKALDASLIDNSEPQFSFTETQLSRPQQSNTMNVGTPLFMAPEIYKENSIYDFNVDVFSFGIIMWMVVTGMEPYMDRFTKRDLLINPMKLQYWVSEGNRPTIEGMDLDENIRDLIERCWHTSPADRPLFDDIYDVLCNDFMIDENVEEKEVEQYVSILTSIEETKQGKKVLDISEDAVCIEFIDNANINIDKKKIFDEVRKNGFNFGDISAILIALKAYKGEIVKDLKFLVKVIDYANHLNSNGNTLAKDLLSEIFQGYIVKGETEEIREAPLNLNEQHQINIPPTIKVIGEGVFKELSKLDFVNIPPSVESLGSKCFYACKVLKVINLNCKITKIPDSCFKDCISLKLVVLPKGLLEICKSAFENCVKLPAINIPGTITDIRRDAFKNCKALASSNIIIQSCETKNRKLNIEKNAFGMWKKPKIV